MSDFRIKPNRSFIKVNRKFYLLGIFGIAMGALEAIVVVYLRQMYYPLGFDFPLTFLSPQMTSVEWLREAATIIMLVYIGMIAGRNSLQRFAYFLYTFAIWDIFYYAWLKLLLDWPSSFFTWDILFLIPVPWIGPMLAPIICSLTMILFSGMIIYLQERGPLFKIKWYEWSLIITGMLIILVTFVWDYSKIMINDGLLSKFWILTNDQQLLKNILNYHPVFYNWTVFIMGEILMLGAFILIFRRVKSDKYQRGVNPIL